ncbi:MAG: hypothetical protein JXR44_01020 [Thiotrichales bacterium]|nr:hypothetical protein [Thiotrichales bacterium]
MVAVRLSLLSLLLLWQLTLPGCSFQLRDSDSMSDTALQRIQLQTEPDTDSAIQRELRARLPVGVELESVQRFVAEPEALGREVTLVLGSTQKSSKRTGVSLLGETTAEFIRWTQPYQILDAQGKVLVRDQAFAYRDRRIDPQGLMAAEQELSDLNRQMAQDLAQQLLSRLRYVPRP